MDRAAVYKFGQNGAFQSRYEIGTGEAAYSYFGYFDPVVRLADGSFASVIDRLNGYDCSIELLRFDGDGNLQTNSAIIGSPAQDSTLLGIRQLQATGDGGFAFCGFKAPPEAYASAWLVKMDSTGMVQWEQQYGYPSQLYEAITVAQYPDGGYVLGGYRLPGSLVNKGFLIRTDSAGNEIWRRHYGNDGSVCGAVRVAEDGGIVTFSSYSEFEWPIYWRQHLLTKWNAQGTIVWQTRSHYGPSVSCYDMEILPDQRMVTSSRTGDYAALALYSSEGDSLWSRRYLVFPNSFIHLPYDVEQTSDGGFVLTGEVSQYIGDPTPGMETIFIIKTDSLGCVVPGCQNVGVQEYVMDLQERLRVSPNPATDRVQMALDLPEGGEVQGQVQAQLLDATGRLVLEQHVQQNLNQLRATLDVGTLPAGTYYLHLRDAKRWLAGSKVVVE